MKGISAPWSCGSGHDALLTRTIGCGAGSIFVGRGIFYQCMESMPNQHGEEFG